MTGLLDTRLTVETPEGIALALRPAGPVPRLYAYAIDFAVRLVVWIVAVIVLGRAGGLGMGLLMAIAFGLEWLYPVVFELTLSGATPGKRALGLRVVMDSGLPVTPGASLLRNLLRAADFLPAMFSFGVASMLLRPDFKRLGDLAAGTVVVHVRGVSLDGTVPEATPNAPARALSPRAQAAVIGWAARSTRLTPARAEELALLAAGEVLRPGRQRDPVTGLQGVAQWLIGKR